ncbi:MAG: hypothetical protein HZA54_03535 [Planctomycetes bacterium]|nr:hypothetical protein [Planctomycetota bacterium]
MTEAKPDRQRELLTRIASRDNRDEDFAITEIVEAAKVRVADKSIRKAFRAGDVNQMLPRLIEAGLVDNNRHGEYSLAVPLFGEYLLRANRRPGGPP